MAFDLTILDRKGAPRQHVSITFEEHSHLIAMAKRLGLSLIQRMSDYYADAHFSLTEIDAFRTELTAVRDDMVARKEDIPQWINDALRLAAEAKACQSGLVGIAD